MDRKIFYCQDIQEVQKENDRLKSELEDTKKKFE